jgi:hypothetical protein
LHVRFGTLLVEEAPAPQRPSDTPGDWSSLPPAHVSCVPGVYFILAAYRQ